MNTKLLLWALIALGIAAVVQALGPWLVGGLLAYALYRYLRSADTR